MVTEIPEDSLKKKLSKFLAKYGSTIGVLLLIPVVATSFVVVHQQQDLRQHAAGPADFLINPPDDAESAASQATNGPSGLLRVSTSNGIDTTISVLKNPERTMVFQMKGQVEGSVLPEGNYLIEFSKAGAKTPATTTFSIKAGQTTNITADFNSGSATVSP